MASILDKIPEGWKFKVLSGENKKLNWGFQINLELTDERRKAWMELPTSRMSMERAVAIQAEGNTFEEALDKAVIKCHSENEKWLT